MTRINLVLLGLLIVCALSLVTSRHQSRQLFIEGQYVESPTGRLAAGTIATQVAQPLKTRPLAPVPSPRGSLNTGTPPPHPLRWSLR